MIDKTEDSRTIVRLEIVKVLYRINRMEWIRYDLFEICQELIRDLCGALELHPCDSFELPVRYSHVAVLPLQEVPEGGYPLRPTQGIPEDPTQALEELNVCLQEHGYWIEKIPKLLSLILAERSRVKEFANPTAASPVSHRVTTVS